MIRTARLELRELTSDDAPFVLALYTDPDFIANVGDRGVRTLEDARRYIAESPVRSYRQHGFGLYLVCARDSGESLGMCGLLRRDWHADVEIGFALLPPARRRGYALEAAAAVVQFARESLRLERVVALTAPDNQSSIRVLEKIGLRFERMVHAPDAPGDSRLFVLQLAAEGAMGPNSPVP
ncbi:MAG TPA: GNAT family N-acetyltransferase [Steroidobacteraceae bacterium]|nr:GNAT family N-acetyltransferase [Steroidobacteraceae bacterium]